MDRLRLFLYVFDMPPGSASQLVLIKVAPPVASAPRLGPDGAFFVRPLHAACHQPAMQAATRRLEHAHEVHHVVLVEKGHSMFLFGGEAVDALPGTLFLISPGQPHSFDVPRGHGVWYSEVTFEIVTSSGNPVHETLHKLLASWSGLFLEPWHQGSPVDPPTFAALSGLIRSVVAAGSQTGVADTFDLDIALTALLHRIAKTMAAPPTDVHDPVKVVRVALTNAASIAGLLLTTETLVTNLDKEDAKKRKIEGSVR